MRTEKPVNNQFVLCAVIAVSVSTVIWFFEKALAFTFERRRNSAGSRQEVGNATQKNTQRCPWVTGVVKIYPMSCHA